MSDDACSWSHNCQPNSYARTLNTVYLFESCCARTRLSEKHRGRILIRTKPLNDCFGIKRWLKHCIINNNNSNSGNNNNNNIENCFVFHFAKTNIARSWMRRHYSWNSRYRDRERHTVGKKVNLFVLTEMYNTQNNMNDVNRPTLFIWNGPQADQT